MWGLCLLKGDGSAEGVRNCAVEGVKATFNLQRRRSEMVDVIRYSSIALQSEIACRMRRNHLCTSYAAPASVAVRFPPHFVIHDPNRSAIAMTKTWLRMCKSSICTIPGAFLTCSLSETETPPAFQNQALYTDCTITHSSTRVQPTCRVVGRWS